MSGGDSRWLLLGNSRWHWAEDGPNGRRYWSSSPGTSLVPAPDRWAAVGPRPAGLDPACELRLAQVPLPAAPPWLGVDRALAGYQAWCRSGAAVLVADAGTALSLTWIDAQGRFQGGRLMAGAALQLRALHQATAALPAMNAAEIGSTTDLWPHQTEQAMAAGVLQGLAGALQRSAQQVLAHDPSVQLWLTGGDGAVLTDLLGRLEGTAVQSWRFDPGLCLDGLARVDGLSPKPDR